MKNLMYRLLPLFFLLVSASLTAQTVFITRTGEKYHKESCSYLRQSKIDIERKKAIDLGYTPCSVCKPGGAGTSAGQPGEQQSSFSPSPGNSQSGQCTATTQSGRRCSRKVQAGRDRCWQH